MKNFKLKLNFLLNLFKKNKTLKKTNIFFENIKNLFKIQSSKKKILDIFRRFYINNFKINYLIFFISLVCFYYLIYLSFPGILHDKSDQNYLTEELKKQYNLEFSLTPEITYSILPKPHFQISDVIIFNNNNNFQKEIAQIKKLKIYLYQKNFFKKRKLEIKTIELFETNFFINKMDIEFVKSFLYKGFIDSPVIIKRANLFYQDMDKRTISFLNLKKINMNFNDKINNDVLTSNGEIFNVPFSISWKQDLNKQVQISNLKFKKINLNILNTSKLINKIKKNKLQIYLNRSRYIVDYDLINKQINFESGNSFIGNDKFIFSGKIYLDPFNFDVTSSLDSLKLKKLLLNSLFLKEILSKDFFLNENFNGRINLIIKNLENNPLFKNLNMNLNFKGQTIELNNSVFLNEKIANLVVKKGILFEEKNNLFFKGQVDFKINDINKLYNKFVVPKKNRNDLKNINFEILINLTNNEFKILKITNDRFKDKEFEGIDELIYEFNSGGIKISNWIEFKIFANKIISSYAG